MSLNPYLYSFPYDPQQRLAQLEQRIYQQTDPYYRQQLLQQHQTAAGQYPQQPQPQPAPTEPPPPGITIVDSEDAARTYPLDISGKVQLFRDAVVDKFYTKQLDPKTANVLFGTYSRTLATPEEPKPDKIDQLFDEVRKIREDLISVGEHLDRRIGESSNISSSKPSNQKSK